MGTVKGSDGLGYRQLQARETRRRIARAAREVFALSGYAAATIESIAQRAGVAPRTVYLGFGTKKAIIGAVCEEWLAEAGVRELAPAVMAEADPGRRLALVAQLNRRQWEAGADVVPMLEAAAASDVEVRSMLDGWKAERAGLLRSCLEPLEAVLRPGLGLGDAVVSARALSAAEIFSELTRGEGWDPDRYERWLARLLQTELLGRASS